MDDFTGKSILISGSARGQGAAEARALVAQGAKVVVSDILVEQGEALARELGDAAVFVRLDVTSEADWQKAVAAAEGLAPLQGLINNAGILQPATLLDTDIELWNRHISINQTGCYLGMRAAIPAMLRAGRGSIVNVSSNAGLQGTPRSFAYGATKWALRGMTKSVALDYATRNIRANSIHPGPVDTEMISGARTPEQNAQFLTTVPMQRMATVDEIVELVLFLLSDKCGYMTGAEIAADGGLSV